MFFNLLLSRAETELKLAQQDADNAPSRPHLFIALALKVVDLFEENSSMKAFVLNVKLTPEDTLEGEERVINMRREFTLSAEGCVELQDEENKLGLILQCTPHWLMADGALSLQSDHALVESARIPEVDSDERYARAFRLALHIDSCFQTLRTTSFVDVVR